MTNLSQITQFASLGALGTWNIFSRANTEEEVKNFIKLRALRQECFDIN